MVLGSQRSDGHLRAHQLFRATFFYSSYSASRSDLFAQFSTPNLKFLLARRAIFG